MNFLQYLQELRNPKEIKLFKREVDKSDLKDLQNASFHEWSGPLSEFMAKYGFKPVGEGASSFVFIHPKYPYAIKVFFEDIGYMKWIQWCMKNKNNEFVPRFRGKVVRINKDFMAVRVEKLLEIGRTNPIFTSFYEAVFRPSKYLAAIDNDDVDEKYDIGYNADLHKLCIYLQQNRAILDIHSMNFMMRKHGEYVLIDPFYDSRVSGKTRIHIKDMEQLKDIF